MYTLTPTEEEFKQFIPYVEGLYKQGIWKYGSIKIIPPQGFNPGNWFNKDSDKKLSTRFQWPYEMSQALVSLIDLILPLALWKQRWGLHVQRIL